MHEFIIRTAALLWLVVGALNIQATAGESLLFIGETAPQAKAMLLRIPDAVPTIRSATLETTFAAGIDYHWSPGSREVRLLEGTRIPYLTPAQLHPEPNAPNAYRHLRDSDRWMLYGPGRFFHDRQCVAEYASSDDWRRPETAAADNAALGRLRTRLKQQQPVTIVVFGDSISTELDCSRLAQASPLQPGYPTLVAESLREQFHCDVRLVNLSVSGKDSAWGVTQVQAVVAQSPHLLLIAFGMNDGSGKRTPAAFAEQTGRIIEPVLAALPECEVLLVSSMTANSEWAFSAPELYGEYAAALRGLCGPRVALADVTTVWQAIDARKKHLDLTGNGLNHPNDYGHRIYAEVILAAIGDAAWLRIPQATQATGGSPR